MNMPHGVRATNPNRNGGKPMGRLGAIQPQKLPRNLPKLNAQNVHALPQLGQPKLPGSMPLRRMPGGMNAPGEMKIRGVTKPRKLAPLGSSAADKGKELLNDALNGGPAKKKKHRHHHKDKKGKKKRKKRPPGSNIAQIAAKKEAKEKVTDPIEAAADQAHSLLCELLDTQKGRGILMQEAKIRKAFREGRLVDLHFKREPNQSLGIAFNIPARVSAMNWVSQQRLIVGNIKKTSPAEVAQMQIDDIVARIGGRDCESIEEFKKDISGKSAFTITVARCKGVTVDDIRKVRQDIEVQVQETARERARELHEV